ncbi:unnamed protein product [Oncorhynchus mykiss]|uniref:Centrosomal protein 78 n=1 Tax=Oncorhynchus mykiss TaxID=8022 RepID=A0A060ZAU3_ONCMY|nr:unnamed protein product [Oncorhynchus mykiss]
MTYSEKICIEVITHSTIGQNRASLLCGVWGCVCLTDLSPALQHQAMRRHSAAWAESLRYRRPEFEGMGGLRRVTLNCNTLVGDRGVAALAQELAEDLWVKALDLQKCGLSNDGTRSLLEALKSNSTLCVLDIRRNPLVDNDLMKSVIERVLMNANGQSSQYSWIKPPALKDSQKPPILKRRILGNTARGKATFRIGPRRLSLAGRRSPVVAQQPHPCSSRCIPWRTAERAGRQRGLPPGNTVAEQSFEGAATVKVTMETESEEEGEEEAVETKSLSPLSLHERITVRQYRRVQVELEECRLRLAEERRARVKADTRLMEVRTVIPTFCTSKTKMQSIQYSTIFVRRWYDLHTCTVPVKGLDTTHSRIFLYLYYFIHLKTSNL